jgi:hypothetical protein
MAVDGKALILLPQLDGADIAVEVGRDLLPGVETGRSVRGWEGYDAVGRMAGQAHGKSGMCGMTFGARRQVRNVNSETA